MTPEEMAAAEATLTAKFGGADRWDVAAYLSPAERQRNKPILPVTDRTTNRMGHPRNWPGPDTALVQASFQSFNNTWHTFVSTTAEGAIEWLMAQDPNTGMVNL